MPHIYHQPFQFNEKDFTIRTPEEHSRHCELLKDASLAEHYSMIYGVNRDSILNTLSFFNVADEVLIPDIMHDMLEGYLPYKTKLMLNHFVRYIAIHYLLG